MVWYGMVYWYIGIAIMSVAIGPSGRNDAYLFNLDTFLSDTPTRMPTNTAVVVGGDQDTKDLAFMTRDICQTNKYKPFFLYGSGSNQHNQLLLKQSKCATNLKNDDEAHDLTEILLLVPTTTTTTSPNTTNTTNNNTNMNPKKLYAGGGHSALLTQDGTLYLWGWNEKGQLGRDTDDNDNDMDDTIIRKKQERQTYYSSDTIVPPLLHNNDGRMNVQHVSLGHSHTLIIESDTGRLYAFGDNNRGQVTGSSSSSPTKDDDGNVISYVATPTTPTLAKDMQFIDASAGLFHSAAIAHDGSELITFGCHRFSQCIRSTDTTTTSDSSSNRWKPSDGSRLVKVVCGRRHTTILDDYGRIWTLGENKYGQLGRNKSCDESSSSTSNTPQLVDGILGTKHSGCFDIDCGWSHNVAFVRRKTVEPINNNDDDDDDEDASSLPSTTMNVYVWGRNDKGQL